MAFGGGIQRFPRHLKRSYGRAQNLTRIIRALGQQLTRESSIAAMNLSPARSPYAASRANVGGAGTTSERRGRGAAGGPGGRGEGEEGLPLFQRTDNMKQEQGKSQSLASLQAMRQFAVDTAGASASASARPKTTGSVRQLAIGGRRQSTGSIRAMMMQQQSNHPAAAGDNARSQQQPRLTRNLTHGDLRWVSSAPATAAFGARRGIGGRDGGTGASSSEVRAALGWQAGTTRLPGTGLAARRQSIDGGGVRLSSPEGQIGFLSRLPLLEAPHTGELLQQHQQRQHQHQHHRQHQHQQHHNHQQQRQEQRQRQQQRPEHNVLDSIETSLLSEHGISFGVSALRGRRPYMEDEYKVCSSFAEMKSEQLTRRTGRSRSTDNLLTLLTPHSRHG